MPRSMRFDYSYLGLHTGATNIINGHKIIQPLIFYFFFKSSLKF